VAWRTRAFLIRQNTLAMVCYIKLQRCWGQENKLRYFEKRFCLSPEDKGLALLTKKKKGWRDWYEAQSHWLMSLTTVALACAVN